MGRFGNYARSYAGNVAAEERREGSAAAEFVAFDEVRGGGAADLLGRMAESAGIDVSLAEAAVRARLAEAAAATEPAAETVASTGERPFVVRDPSVVFDGGRLAELLGRVPARPKTTTELARGAVATLQRVTPPVVSTALKTVVSRSIAPADLMRTLERRVLIGEVLNKVARSWTQETKTDFAEALGMPADQFDVMDVIVSVAILNEPDVEAEIRAENTPQTTSGDLLDQRRIVWQFPERGAVVAPPYLVLVAVEHRDVVKADEVVKPIFGDLGTFQNFRLPRTVAEAVARLPWP